jgi:hypothetical protein
VTRGGGPPALLPPPGRGPAPPRPRLRGPALRPDTSVHTQPERPKRLCAATPGGQLLAGGRPDCGVGSGLCVHYTLQLRTFVLIKRRVRTQMCNTIKRKLIVTFSLSS